MGDETKSGEQKPHPDLSDFGNLTPLFARS